MKYFLPFIVSGLADGAIYGLLGAGLVLTYKVSGILNFGYGAIATVAAYLFYAVHYRAGVPWVPATGLCVLVAGPALGVAMERLGRSLSRQTTTLQIVGTIGIVLLVEGLGTLWYGPNTTSVGQFLPKGSDSFHVFGTAVLYSQAAVFGFGLLCVVGLYLLFRFTRVGIAMRAVVDDGDLVMMQGTSARRVRLAAWVTACVLAAASGVLVLPSLGLNATVLTLLIVQAFGAAAIGLFSNIPVTFIGGLGIGVLADVSQKYVLKYPIFAGIPDSVPFIVLLVAILLGRRRLFSHEKLLEYRPRIPQRVPGVVRGAGAVGALGLLALLPLIVGGDKVVFLSVGLSQGILLLSVGLLARQSGQVSLCQATFAAISACVFSQFTVGDGIPWVFALVLASIIVAPVGGLLAYPASKLSGVFLALATLAFGIMVQQLFYSEGFMFTSLVSGRSIPRPAFATSDVSYYYVVLVCFVVVAGVTVAICRARLGRMLRAIGSAPVAANALGLSSNLTRVLVFALAAVFAGAGGILYAGAEHFAVSSDPYFQPLYSITLLAILAIAPGREPWYALPAVFAAILPGYLSGSNVQQWLNVLFGVSAIIVAMQGGPPPMPLWLSEALASLGRRRGPGGMPARRLPLGPLPAEQNRGRGKVSGAGGQGPSGLEIRELSVRFGGLVAVDDVSLTAEMNRITGLIGPNGAGKTTVFNACSGIERPLRGSIALHGHDITRLDSAARARVGLGRTFQGVRLLESQTVAENVALGREAALAGRALRSQLAATRRERRATDVAVDHALALCGIADLADVQADEVPVGQRKLIEVARCLAGEFDLLLLDEPSAGLNESESARLGEVLRRVVEEKGLGILLVEHDMALVMSISTQLYVLDYGRVIFSGAPGEAARDRRVQDAYLGSGLEVELDGSTLGSGGSGIEETSQ